MKNIAIFAGTLATCLLLARGPAAAQEETQAPALTVSLVEPAKEQWPETIPVSGWLKPWHEATIASETSGLRIKEVLVDVGSVVKKGDVLVRLDQAGVLADLKKQEAAVETGKANLEKATSEAKRARDIASGVLSDQKRVEYFNTERTAQAALASEEAALEGQRIKVSQTTITAVDDGIITSRSASLGAVVSTGTELFRLTRQQRIEWQAEVPALSLLRVEPGQAAEIDAPDGRTFKGMVRLVAPTISDETGRAIVYVQLPEEPKPRAGLYVSGRIDITASKALTVPESSIVYRDGLAYVFVIDEESRAHRVRVKVGRRRSDRVEVSEGLAGGERVVQAGGAFLSENALVKIEEAAR
ncbi:efflux RND transporter periplasmic adaptor subunit [Sinorhizobium terangae]|uniref:Efflux RND transporter periplasmic adaptor subunit n=1 Tax=Sinorhizobium terangae TaxID=110322 RepID=A0A6N7LNF5_SINTE|nr:efflux RND transporter periplasmic adaptor subunit [Sinorhizobium terangae]MBB4188892.1 RND family efflux transporter MFP subunit [Sinorhizobium terangae]MQX19277.1 efflux RND transporter periplasmic adaptor subunit [Sinorhizobium terangae]WFU51247.1 efflux RND transporter periplasmic adaptor subunit [Sinorhizobium terangae]